MQFGTGTNINLLPLGAGQLYSRLKQDEELCNNFDVSEIIFRRPEDPKAWAAQLNEVFVIGFSAFMWTVNISLNGAKAVKERFPNALIVVGGPSIPKDHDYYKDFMNDTPYIDVICCEEGEEAFVSLCHYQLEGKDFSDIPGIIYRDGEGQIQRTNPEELSLDTLPSPFLDGTFDQLYEKYGSEFSGIIWETNRGCPYDCTFCTWANLPTKKIREKPMDQVEKEINWIGRNKIGYIAMCDSNFGIRKKRDLRIAQLLAECKKKYGVPNFISVSWAKNSYEPVLAVARILKNADIGFRVTLSLQSTDIKVTNAIKRSNTKKEVFDRIKEEYRNEQMYTYTELILGLPSETRESFINGIDMSLSESIFDQLYLYPCFLFPNTEMASKKDRKKFGIEGVIIPNRYTKSKEYIANEEIVEIVVGTNTMPKDRWIDSFVIGYYTLALHDDRLAFFILNYLKKTFSVSITDIITFARKISHEKEFPTIRESFCRLENTASGVQDLGHSHLIEPRPFDIPYDPPDGIFLELVVNKYEFYDEFYLLVEKYLKKKKIHFDRAILKDLFTFQNAVMAHPNGPPNDGFIQLNYNWPKYFAFAFYRGSESLRQVNNIYKVVDPKPSNGDPLLFLENHFDIRGIPPFNDLYDESGKRIFPLFDSQPVAAHVSLTNKQLIVESKNQLVV